MKIFLCVLFILLIFVTVLVLCNRVLLISESGRLKPPGKMVTVNGHRMHVYADGPKGGGPTLVFLSGSGTACPSYDFRPLYTKLSPDYRVAVPERAGYGYSDSLPLPRDIDTVLEETREALSQAGESAPYVLFPHSLSGLEALYWAEKYPDEILGIVGLDAACPEAYRHCGPPSAAAITLLRGVRWLGVQRLPFISRVDLETFGEEARKQIALLTHRNFFNINIQTEGKMVCVNAETVEQSGFPQTRFLLFTSDGKGIGPFWLPCQEALAKRAGAELIQLNCGHYLHHFASDEIAVRARAFLNSLKEIS